MKRLRNVVLGGVCVAALLAAAGWGWLRWYGSESQDPAFFDDAVAAFASRDAASPPAPGSVVFTGSSSIRLWSTLAADMAPIPVVNRGFGGSHCAHVARHASTLTAGAPSAIVVYCGDNDLGSGKSSETVLADFQAFLDAVRAELGGMPILFVAIKPSILRWEDRHEITSANAQIEGLAEGDPALHYVDIATPMLGADATPREELFVFDGLHLSAEGYDVWTRAVRPLLEAVLSSRYGNP